MKIYLISYDYDLGFDKDSGVHSAYKTEEKRNKELKKLEKEDSYFNYTTTEIILED